MDVRQFNRNRVLTWLAAGSLLAVAGYWAWQLTVPAADVGSACVPLAAIRAHPAPQGLAVPLVGLLSPGSVTPQVQVLGVLAGSHASLALLSVDAAPAQAFTVGQRLGPSTRVTAIAADIVTLEQAGQSRVLPVPALPPLPAQDIVGAGVDPTR